MILWAIILERMSFGLNLQNNVDNKMRKIVFLILALTCHLALQAQDSNSVVFEFSDGIEASALKTKMERQVMNLLTAINIAEATNSDINYSGVEIDNLASQSIGMTWNNVHFRTEDSDIVEHCIRREKSNKTLRGFQVRNIGVTMKPLDSAYDSEKRREICIEFSPSGQIVDFNFAMEVQTYTRLMKEGVRLDDVDRRMQIISWCEQFRKAYEDKNLKFMDNIFSDDALIITGRLVMQRVKSDIAMADVSKVEYVTKNKQQYLSSLRRVFDREKYNGYINVEFSDYEIKRHASKPNYYGVTLRQKWHSSQYSDDGIVFLVWDFSNEDQPKIHVRTWQPLGEEAFQLNQFKLP